MNCDPCDHAAEHGHWGQQGSHCRKCHRSWTSKKQGHCPTCCAHFGGPSLFDRHLLTRGCTDPATVTNKDGSPVFRQDDLGVWRSFERFDAAAFGGVA